MPSPTDRRPYTRAEIDRWTEQRRPHEREEIPAIGERLLLREVNFGEEKPAIVVAVQDMSSPHDHWNRHGGLEHLRGAGIPDVNVWRWDETRGEHVLHPDPWPWVQVQVITGEDGDGNPVLAAPRWCREARVRGSAGWLRPGSRAHTGRYEETGE
jgi:hypothetical protein